MAGLIATRQALAESLADSGYQVKSYIPEQISPPMVILGAGDPYIEEDGTFDRSVMQVNLELWLLVASASNEKQTNDLDTLLQAILPHTGTWSVAVDQPDLLTLGQATFFGLRMHVSNTFDLG